MSFHFSPRRSVKRSPDPRKTIGFHVGPATVQACSARVRFQSSVPHLLVKVVVTVWLLPARPGPKRGRGAERIATLIDTPSMPECEALFQITSGGICDAS
eukprot:2482767-Rhodomonas_salina.1